MTQIDVAVCVRDARDYVERCLRSVVAAGEYERVILIDDGSKPETASWLSKFSGVHGLELRRHERSLGYTSAANRALTTSTSGICVLLNSDTVVPQGWIGRLAQVFASHPTAGLVGPLSNAATWQSAPRRFSSEGVWSDGEWMSPEDLEHVDALAQHASQHTFPVVPLLNGFCMAIRRAVIDRVGKFDEDAFPRGYGEENDFCVRAGAAGFELRVADHVFVYHAKSRSYGHRRRRWLRWRAAKALHRKHGADRIAELTEVMRAQQTLASARAALGDALRIEPS